MPNITSVTNPVPGHEGASRPLPTSPNDPKIQNIPDPTRVGRLDGRTDRDDASNANITTRHFGSNFQAFLRSLQANGTITQSLAHMLYTLSGTLVSSGMAEGISTEFAEFLSMLPVSPEKMPDLLKTLMDGSVRFTGKLSDYLRGILENHTDQHVRTDVAQFLKAYNDFAASGHIERGMVRDVQQMAWFMPERFATPLQDQLSQLKQFISNGDRPGALRLLHNTLLPYMSDYVSKMRDFGIARNLLSLLTLDIARYENGSLPNVLQTFRQLAAYDDGTSANITTPADAENPAKNVPFNQMSDKEIVAMLNQEVSEAAQKDHPISKQLVHLASHALQGEAGPELQQTLQNLVDSILINQSVYMPLCHVMLPAEIEDRKMFSEFWVDPDAENSGSVDPAQRTIRLLLKFDIEGVGFFDMTLACRNRTVDLDLRCPKWLGGFSNEIQSAITELTQADGMIMGNARVGAMQRPLTISEVFPKIFERKDSIDVSI